MEDLTEDMVTEPSDTVKNKICVAVRVRPFIERELAENEEKWTVNDNGLTQNDDMKTGAGVYTYDHVFGKQTQTKKIYDEVVAPVVNQAFKGFSGTVLCYGQTSSGKTHTLYGSNTDKGIISLFAEHLFRQVKKDEGSKEYIVSVGVIEIYNEKLTDLLNSDNTIDIQERQGTIVPTGLEQLTVNCSQELIEISERAQQQRKTGETAMNKNSSRSHTALRVQIVMADLCSNRPDNEFAEFRNPALTKSILHFVDLAGSEKQSQTGAVGERLNEAININKSLSCLSRVINSLSVNAEQNEKTLQRSAVTDPRREPRSRFVNYRDSKLTRLLQGTLNGEAHITMICNVTIANVAETKSTLEFANRAKNIKVKPIQNFGTSNEFEKKVLELQQSLQMRDQENERLQKKIEHLQKIMPQTKAPLQLLRTPEMRRYSLCHPVPHRHEDNVRKTLAFFKAPLPTSRLSDEEFMSSADTTMHFQQLTKDRELQIIDRGCDKDTQTEYRLCIASGQVRQKIDLNDTPVTTLRMCNSLLRDASECDHSEWSERITFLEEENKVLRVFEKENEALRQEHAELHERIVTLNSEKVELENDVLRQVEASKKGWCRQMAEYDEKRSKEFGDLQQSVQELQLKLKESETMLIEKEALLLDPQNKSQKAQEELEQTKGLLAESQRSLAEKATEIEQAKNEFQETQAELEGAKSLLESLQLNLYESKQNLAQKETLLVKNKQDLQKAQEELEQTKGLLAESQRSLAEKATQIVLIKNEFQKAQEEVQETNSLLQTYQLKLAESEHNLVEKESLMEALEELERTKGLVGNLQLKLGESEQNLLEKQSQLDKNKNDLQKAQDDLEETKSLLQTVQLKLSESEHNFVEKESLQKAQAELDETKCMLQTFQLKLGESEQILLEKESQLERNKTDLQKTQKELEETKGLLETFQLKLGESEQNLLKKEAQLDKNNNDLQKAQEEVEQTKGLLRTFQLKLSESERNFVEKESLQKAQAELEETKGLLQTFQLKLGESEQNLLEKESQLDKNNNDLQKALEELERTKGLVGNLQLKLADSEQNLLEKESHLDKNNNDLQKAQKELEETKGLLETFQAKLAESEQNLLEKESQLGKNKTDLQKALEELERTKGLVGNLQLKLAESEQNLLEKESQLDKNNNDLQKAQEDLEEAKGLQQTCQLKLTQSEQNLLEKESLILQNKNDLQKAQKELEETKGLLQTSQFKLRESEQNLREKEEQLDKNNNDFQHALEELERTKGLVENLQLKLAESELNYVEKESLQKAQKELERTKTLVENLQLKLADSEQNILEKKLQLDKNKNGLQKAQKELEETKGLLETFQLKLGESEHNLVEKESQLVKNKTDLKKAEMELTEAVGVRTDLEHKLKELENVGKQLQAFKDSETALRVSRGAQCEIISDSDFSELIDEGKKYRNYARCVKAQLDKYKNEIACLEEKDKKIANLEATIEAKDVDIKSLQDIILDVPEPILKFSEGTQCTLLHEQFNRAGKGEQGLLPDFVPDIYKLNKDLKSTREKAERLQSLVTMCQCEASGKPSYGLGFKSTGGYLGSSGPFKFKATGSSGTMSLGFRPPSNYRRTNVSPPKQPKTKSSTESTRLCPEDNRENTPPSPPVADLEDPEQTEIVSEPKKSYESFTLPDISFCDEDPDEFLRELQAMRDAVNRKN